MKDKTSFIFIGIGAVLITAFFYYIDSDPPYADFKKTIFEFSLFTIIIFSFLVAVYYIAKSLIKLIKG